MDATIPGEVTIPEEVSGALRQARSRLWSRTGQLRVRVGASEHAVTDLSSTGFVIAADGRPPLRGYADIFMGEERILHGLVVCSWAADGLIGYDFKRAGPGRPVSPDHAPTAAPRLLEGPRR